MSLIALGSVTRSFGGPPVLDGVSLTVARGQKLGVVGENGSGKSTLLRLIAGLEQPDSGDVTVARSARLCLVPQRAGRSSTRTSLEEALRARPSLVKLRERMQALEAEGQPEAYADAVAEYGDARGYDLERQAREALRALGLDDAQIAAPLDTLSGGERSRVALARALLSDATVLLLDEPDCHLDVDGIAWLERALCRHRGALLLVTHDRDLLDRVVDGIVEVEDGKVTCERGNVSDYLAHKTERVQRQKQEYLEQQRRVRKLQAAISRQAGTARGIELRTIHFHYRKKALKTARRAVVLKRRIERELGEARRVERPVERRPGARLDLAPRRWDARTVLRLDGIHKAYGERHVLRDVSLELPRGQRVALVGANGTGKTTLLEVALGRLPADAGDVWLSQGARPFYCDQHKGGLEPGLTVFETIQKHTGLGRNQTHHLLARLLFTGDALDTPVEALSGGERTRLVLALLMNAQADLLLLDEPTNHLDLPGIEVLQAALAQYEGALLFVSHDRRLVRSVATHVVELCDGRLVRQPRPVD